jgi:phenylalanyl-tRNA synthetase beta chain
MNQAIPASRVIDLAKKYGQEELRDIACTDDYRGQGVISGRKRVTYRFVYQATDRTLTDDEVNKWQDELVKTIKEKSHF